MDDIYVLGELILAGGLIIGSTVIALMALCRREPRGKTLKTWFRRFFEVIAGL
jgi:hypothetical protein